MDILLYQHSGLPEVERPPSHLRQTKKMQVAESQLAKNDTAYITSYIVPASRALSPLMPLIVKNDSVSVVFPWILFATYQGILQSH